MLSTNNFKLSTEFLTPYRLVLFTSPFSFSMLAGSSFTLNRRFAACGLATTGGAWSTPRPVTVPGATAAAAGKIRGGLISLARRLFLETTVSAKKLDC